MWQPILLSLVLSFVFCVDADNHDYYFDGIDDFQVAKDYYEPIVSGFVPKAGKIEPAHDAFKGHVKNSKTVSAFKAKNELQNLDDRFYGSVDLDQEDYNNDENVIVEDPIPDLLFKNSHVLPRYFFNPTTDDYAKDNKKVDNNSLTFQAQNKKPLVTAAPQNDLTYGKVLTPSVSFSKFVTRELTTPSSLAMINYAVDENNLEVSNVFEQPENNDLLQYAAAPTKFSKKVTVAPENDEIKYATPINRNRILHLLKKKVFPVSKAAGNQRFYYVSPPTRELAQKISGVKVQEDNNEVKYVTPLPRYLKSSILPLANSQSIHFAASPTHTDSEKIVLKSKARKNKVIHNTGGLNKNYAMTPNVQRYRPLLKYTVPSFVAPEPSLADVKQYDHGIKYAAVSRLPVFTAPFAVPTEEDVLLKYVTALPQIPDSPVFADSVNVKDNDSVVPLSYVPLRFHHLSKSLPVVNYNIVHSQAQKSIVSNVTTTTTVLQESTIATTTVATSQDYDIQEKVMSLSWHPKDVPCFKKPNFLKLSTGQCKRHYVECYENIATSKFCDGLFEVFSNSSKSCVAKALTSECNPVFTLFSVEDFKMSSKAPLVNSLEKKSFCLQRGNGIHRHPNNCSRIVQCFGKDQFEYPPCAHNLAFDESTSSCNYRDQTEGCSVKSKNFVEPQQTVASADTAVRSKLTDVVPSTAPTNPIATALLASSGCNGRSHGDHISNIDDCSKFFRCVWDRLVPMNCPFGTVFNPSLGVCDYPDRVDCNALSRRAR